MIFTKPTRSNLTFWFSLSLAFAAFYGVLVLQQAFSSDYVVQDDARQHIFWMRRFLDPTLFPQDLIADYFQSVAPWGYTTFYRLFALLGLDPMLVAKLVPIVLGLVTAAYSFWLGLQLLPIPLAGFLTSLLIQQVIWTHDDVASATPRAFLAPIFVAFLYYLSKRQLLPCLVTIVLQGLFYPQYVFVMTGMVLLQLVQWDQGKLQISRSRQDYWFCGILVVAAIGVMLPYALDASEYGPTITAAEARTLPEFNPGGRSHFFNPDPWKFWVTGGRSGLFPYFEPKLIAIGILLPVLMRFPVRFPLVQQISRSIGIVPQLAIVGLGWYGLAHLVLFKLHLPSRYSSHTLRLVLALATAISLTLLLDALWQWAKRQASSRQTRKILAGSVSGVIALVLLLYPFSLPQFPKTNYHQGKYPALYQFFAQQPSDILVAGLPEVVDDLPSFSRRSVLVSKEYAIPYHTRYANQFRQRVTELLNAQYSLQRSEVESFIRNYGIDYWIVSRAAFKPDFFQENWIKQYPEATEAATANLKQGNPFVRRSINRCVVAEDKAADLYVLEAACLMRQS